MRNIVLIENLETMKNKRNVWICCCSMFALAACQQGEEELSKTDGTLDLYVQAAIAGSNAPARSVTNEEGIAEFSQHDEIGLFMPDAQEQVKWTLDGGNWNPEGTPKWKDKVNTYQFCAYYPYSQQTVSRTEVVMPDLSGQSGTWEKLGKHDFLVARCSASYKTQSGAVSFTGESAFCHVYGLVVVTLQKDEEADNVFLTQEKFEGEGFFSLHHYRFAGDAGEDGMVAIDESAEKELILKYKNEVEVETGGGHAAVVLVNPSESDKALRYTATYRRDNIDYTATTDQLVGPFQAGYCYKYKLKLSKEGLKVVGKEIVRWEVQPIKDIIITEDPVSPSV